MGYREEVKAARARVNNLEAEVAKLTKKLERKKRASKPATHSKSSLTLTRELAKLKKTSSTRIAELETKLADQPSVARKAIENVKRLRTQAKTLTKRGRELEGLLEAAQRQAAHGKPMPSLIEHNVSAPPLRIVGARPSALLCPSCLASGVNVELAYQALSPLVVEGIEQVVCPRCLYAGYARI